MVIRFVQEKNSASIPEWLSIWLDGDISITAEQLSTLFKL
jgi:hypothetical protein